MPSNNSPSLLREVQPATRYLEIPQRVYDELYREQREATEREKVRRNFDKLPPRRLVRLGADENVTARFRDKPKGIHRQSYDRLRRVHDHAFERSLMGLAKSAERVKRWLRA